MTTLPQTTPIRVPRPLPAGTITVPAGMAPAGGVMAAGGGMTAADVVRVVRQNAWLIILALVAGALGGVFLNQYLLGHYARYRSSGLVVVRSPSQMPEPNKNTDTVNPQEIQLLQETHCQTITNPSLFIQLMAGDTDVRKTDWYKSFQDRHPNDPVAAMSAMKEDIYDNLRATPRRGSQLIEVEMTTPNKDDAKVIVRELVDLHVRNFSAKRKADEEGALQLLKKEKELLSSDLDEYVNKQLREKETELGRDTVEVSANYNGKRMQLDRLLQQRSEISGNIAGLKSQMESLDKDLHDGRVPPEVQAALSRDGRYLQAKQRVDDMDIEIDQLKIKLGEQHDQTVSLMQRRSGYQQKLDQIREELKSDYSETYRSQLRNQLSAYTANAEVIDLEVTRLATDISKLNQSMQVYQVLKEKEKRLRDRLSEMENEIRRVQQFRLASTWSQVDWNSRPESPDFPVFPKLSLTLAASLLLALALSLGVAFLRELTDTTVRSPQDIAKVGQLTLLGLIPHEQDDPQAAAGRLPLAIFDAPNSHIAEQFRQIRTRLQYAHSLDTTRSLLITSPSPEDGKSTVATNLAAALALNGRRILLVDSNFRRPQLHLIFNISNEVGFGEALVDLSRMGECVVQTEVPNLSLMAAGARPANPTELLESQFFVDFVERALEEYDHVIFDGGPLLMVSEAVAMAPRVDGVMTVVRARGNSRGLLERLRDELRRLKAEHLGVVLNAVRSQGGGYYSRNIKRYYAYENV